MYEERRIADSELEGRGPNGHLLVAAEYYKQAAEKDLPEAHYSLARLFEQKGAVFGYAPAEARSLAVKHFRRAADLGFAQAGKALKNLGESH